METRKQRRVLVLVLLAVATAFLVWLSHQVADQVTLPQPNLEGAAETHPPVAWDELLHASEPCASGINVLWILPNPHDTWGSSLWSGWEIAEAISTSLFLFYHNLYKIGKYKYLLSLLLLIYSFIIVDWIS
jgi:hypothetical protein